MGRQAFSLRQRHRGGRQAREGGFIVPEQAIDAQSLIAFADLVISAGGTMNREAAVALKISASKSLATFAGGLSLGRAATY